MNKNQYDIAIIGGGIVGLATAYKLSLSHPKKSIVVIEKEDAVARHQTGNNSGVIHSGIYYKPGSLKAINCINGYNQMLDFCQKYDITHEICGKVIVQTHADQAASFDNIFERGKANKLENIRLLSSEEVKEIEPHVACLRGILVPQTGIINYTQVTQKYLELFLQLGGTILFNTKVLAIKTGDQNIISTNTNDIEAKLIINCAGLYSDKVTKMTEVMKDTMIIPFRGEYYKLKKEKSYLVKHLIYPVPNPDFPFLGVHFTRMVNGDIEAGPNAVLAFRREGYKRWDINPKELFEVLMFPGFRKVASKYWDEGWMEMKRSFSKKLFVKAMQELIPEINADDVQREGAGVRAQACHIDGNLIDDFKIVENKNIINVCNAPSPAATSSLSIGETIANMVGKKLV